MKDEHKQSVWMSYNYWWKKHISDHESTQGCAHND